MILSGKALNMPGCVGGDVIGIPYAPIAPAYSLAVTRIYRADVRLAEF